MCVILPHTTANCSRSKQGVAPDPLEMYDGLRYGNAEFSPLQKLARRLLAITANSVSLLLVNASSACSASHSPAIAHGYM